MSPAQKLDTATALLRYWPMLVEPIRYGSHRLQVIHLKFDLGTDISLIRFFGLPEDT